jgi:hypothetical protein
VIHHFAGVQPDMPNGRLTVVPDIPESWPGLSVNHLRVGHGLISIVANKSGNKYMTSVEASKGWTLVIGHTLPDGVHVKKVLLDGVPVKKYQLVNTSRGQEVRVQTDTAKPHQLTVIAQ